MADRFISFEGDERNAKQSIYQFFNGKFSVFITSRRGLQQIRKPGNLTATITFEVNDGETPPSDPEVQQNRLIQRS